MAKRQELRTIISADARQFKRSLGQVKQMTAQFVKVASAGAVVTAAGFAALTKHTADYGDEIGKAAKRTGIAVDDIQRLRLVSELSGQSMQVLENGVKRMSRSIFDLGNGSAAAKDAFRAIGITMADVKGKSPADQFMTLMEALAGVEDMSRRSAIAQQIFGRSGQALLPFISDGAKGLRDMMAAADGLPIFLDEKQIRQAEQFKDSLFLLQQSFMGLGRQVVAGAFPQMINGMDELTKRVGKFANSPEFAAIKTEFAALAGNIGDAMAQFMGAEAGDAPVSIAEGIAAINKQLEAMIENKDFIVLRDTLVTIAKLLDTIFTIGRKTSRFSPLRAIREGAQTADIINEERAKGGSRSEYTDRIRSRVRTTNPLATGAANGAIGFSDLLGSLEDHMRDIRKSVAVLPGLAQETP